MKSGILKKALKPIAISTGVLVTTVTATTVAFAYLSPELGGTATEAQKAMYAVTGHYDSKREKFTNAEEIKTNLTPKSIYRMLKETANKHPNATPTSDELTIHTIDPSTLKSVDPSTVKVTWLGHSTFIIHIDGLVVLLDPMFSEQTGPHPWVGTKRYQNTLAITIEDLPEIDAVVISHDHYDHLDYPSIQQLRSKTKHFYVPLGVGNHLRRWEVSESKITEFDWWQEQQLGDVTFAFTPSRHMAGRWLTDQYATLWGSWVIQGTEKNIYFSGDGGYGHHFKKIGEKYGGFDLALMESGQYNTQWADVHMMPEESIQASFDLKAKRVTPIHWSCFTLATHSWTDPAERFVAEAHNRNLPVTTPRIGESIILTGEEYYPTDTWWKTE